MKYYLTTPIYYVNAAPHIGHAYTTIAADTIKRFERLRGREAFLTTGTDEHGVNVERSAQAAGKSPQEYATLIAEEFRQTWETLGIPIDFFIRTSDPAHHETVKWLFERCRANGSIYPGSYTGQYCIHDNLYVNEAKPGDPCPECGRPTETVTEENYFFKLSAFQDRLLQLYEDQPDFILPETRRNEVLSFVRQGLNDLSITRTTIKWGIPAPVDGNHVFYVWFDALISYMTAVRQTDLWPADLHLIGKEIVRFHAVYWPAFLMAADLPLPKRIFAHGWLLFDNAKMSKSRGNIVRATPIRQVMGTDALRYYLLREVVFGADGNFSYEALVNRYNADLANGLGNLASRTLNMIKQYRGGMIPGTHHLLEVPGEYRETFKEKAGRTIEHYTAAFDRFEFSRGIEEVLDLISRVDKLIVQQAPWVLAKKTDEASQHKLDDTLYTAAEALRLVTVLLYPVIPDSCETIWRQLGLTQPLREVRIKDLAWGQLNADVAVGELQAVFPRLDVKATSDKLADLEFEETTRQALLMGRKPPERPRPEPAPDPAVPAELATTAPPAMQPGVDPIAPTITIDDFVKVDLRVARVLAAQPVKGADKLLHLTVDAGEAEPRSIVAGIAMAYKPEQLVGRKVVIVANLQPRKLRGIPSNGMIVAASLEGGSPVLAAFLEDVPIGARLK